jgi:hypothetical protein
MVSKVSKVSKVGENLLFVEDFLSLIVDENTKLQIIEKFLKQFHKSTALLTDKKTIEYIGR